MNYIFLKKLERLETQIKLCDLTVKYLETTVKRNDILLKIKIGAILKTFTNKEKNLDEIIKMLEQAEGELIENSGFTPLLKATEREFETLYNETMQLQRELEKNDY